MQTFSPSNRSADQMCKNFPGPDGKPDGTEVGGCAELGDGASGSSANTNALQAGSSGSAGAQGSPAANIVDKEAWTSPPVACHELGHNVGGPGKGGDFLANVGEGHRPPEPQPAGMGLEALGSASACYEQDKNYFAIEGGGDLGSSCNFTSFGCASLQGGANPNDGRHVWEPSREGYFAEDPEAPQLYDFLAGRSFFDPPPPPKGRPPVPPNKQESQQELTYNERAMENNASDNAIQGSGGPPLGPAVGHKGMQNQNLSVNSIRNQTKVPPSIPKSEGMSPAGNPPTGGDGSGPSLGFDEEAKKVDDQDGTATNVSQGGSAPTESSSSASSGSGGSGAGSAGGLGFNENAPKPEDQVEAAAKKGSNGSGVRTPASAEKKDSGYQFDANFWKSIGQAEDRRKRVKGSSLRDGPSGKNSFKIYQETSSGDQSAD